jgi:DNA-binding GntR family transcriptional regulator
VTTETRGSAQTAYEQIRRAIVEGRYRPGQRLIEQRIAEEFALSRTPVREALRWLEAEGLVRSEPNRGAVVREITFRDITDMYGLRARLEAYAAELACTRITPTEIAAIDEGIAAFAAGLAMDTESPVDRTRALEDANRQIHGSILEAAQHPRLAQLLGRTVDIPLVFQAFRQFDPDQLQRSHMFHQLIRDAIAAGDQARASALMFEHIMQGRDVLVAHLETADDVHEMLGADSGRKDPGAR